MHVLSRKIRDVLPVQQDQERWEEKNFDINRMIRSFGDWTLVRLRICLTRTHVLCCGKEHEEKRRGYEYCEHFEKNLVCGHLLHAQSADHSPLRNAGGMIATAAYVTDQFGEKISDRCIPVLSEIAERSHLLDGAAYVAFDNLRDHPPGHFTSVPDNYRQPDLEAIKDLQQLRVAIMKKEGDLGPDMVRLRDEVLAAYEKVLGLSQAGKISLSVV
jgi:hypothetical protein